MNEIEKKYKEKENPNLVAHKDKMDKIEREFKELEFEFKIKQITYKYDKLRAELEYEEIVEKDKEKELREAELKSESSVKSVIFSPKFIGGFTLICVAMFIAWYQGYYTEGDMITRMYNLTFNVAAIIALTLELDSLAADKIRRVGIRASSIYAFIMSVMLLLKVSVDLTQGTSDLDLILSWAAIQLIIIGALYKGIRHREI